MLTIVKSVKALSIMIWGSNGCTNCPRNNSGEKEVQRINEVESMAVAIIVLSIISLFAVGIAMITFQPAIFDLAYNNSFWEEQENIDVRLLVLRDSMYGATIAVPALMVGVVAVWALLAVSRRDDV